ncbi:GIY-YIG nuclease family protein [Candidatus Shapirobacteria bacterium]|nr:GIY-YIG nuclease family protein [Candidatus Shapirobacteria bacterium]
MEFVVYVLINSETNKIYIGQTTNLEKRIDRHNGLLANRTKSYTSKNKNIGIWLLGYKEVLKTRKEAIIREKELKSYQGRQFLKIKLGR